MILKFKEVIEQAGYSQRELSRISGLSYPTINSLYNGTTTSISFKTLDLLCDILHCTPNDLLVTNSMQSNKSAETLLRLDGYSSISEELVPEITEELRKIISDEVDRKIDKIIQLKDGTNILVE